MAAVEAEQRLNPPFVVGQPQAQPIVSVPSPPRLRDPLAPPPPDRSAGPPPPPAEAAAAAPSEPGRRRSDRVAAQDLPRPPPPSNDSDNSASQSSSPRPSSTRKRKAKGVLKRSPPKPKAAAQVAEKKKKSEGQFWPKRPLRPKSAGPPPPLDLDDRLDWKFCVNCGWRRPLDYDRTWDRMENQTTWFTKCVPNWEDFEDKHRILCEGCINIFWQKVMKKLPKDIVRIPGLKKQPQGYTLLDIPRAPSVGVEQGLVVWRNKYYMGDLKHNHPNTRALHHGTEADHEPEETRREGVQVRGGRHKKGKKGVATIVEDSDLSELEDEHAQEDEDSDDEGEVREEGVKDEEERVGDWVERDEEGSRDDDDDGEEDRCEGPSRNRDQPHSSSKRLRTE